MITEFRRLVFSADEITKAVKAFDKAKATNLLDGEITRIEFAGEHEVCARVWTKESSASAQQPELEIKADHLGAALIFYCVQCRIPLPRTAKKALEHAGDGLALSFTIDPATISANAAVAGKAPRLNGSANGKLGKRGTGQLILVLEDDAEIRSLAVSALQYLGFETLEAADTKAATEFLEQRGDGLNLLLSDIMLSGDVRGTQFAEQAMARHPALKVVFMTGYALDPAIGDEASKIGVSTVWKPFKRSDLAAAVYEALNL